MKVLVLSVAFCATYTLFAWSGIPLQDNDRIEMALARGSAEEPSAVFPLTIPGEPVGCWWDETAFHVGGRAFAFADLGVKPADGATFKVQVPRNGGKPLALEVVLKEKAAAYKVEDFGILGNREVEKTILMTAKAG